MTARPVLAAVLALACTASVAAPLTPGYNYLELAWLQATPDEELPGSERDGYQGLLSAPLEPQHYLHLRYARSEDEAGSAVKDYTIGLGYYSHWRPGADFYLILGYDEFKSDGFKDKGYSGEAGIRWMLNQRLELFAGGRHLRLKELGGDTSWFGGLALELVPGLGLAGRYERLEDETRYTVGLRLLPF